MQRLPVAIRLRLFSYQQMPGAAKATNTKPQPVASKTPRTTTGDCLIVLVTPLHGLKAMICWLNEWGLGISATFFFLLKLKWTCKGSQKGVRCFPAISSEPVDMSRYMYRFANRGLNFQDLPSTRCSWISCCSVEARRRINTQASKANFVLSQHVTTSRKHRLDQHGISTVKRTVSHRIIISSATPNCEVENNRCSQCAFDVAVLYLQKIRSAFLGLLFLWAVLAHDHTKNQKRSWGFMNFKLQSTTMTYPWHTMTAGAGWCWLWVSMCSQRFSQAQSNLQASGSHGDKCCEAPPAAPKSIASWDSNGIPTKFQRCGCRQHFFHSTLELVSRWQVATHLRTERAACGKRGLFHWLVPRPSVGRPFGTTNHRAAAVPTVGVNILKISKQKHHGKWIYMMCLDTRQISKGRDKSLTSWTVHKSKKTNLSILNPASPLE